METVIKPRNCRQNLQTLISCCMHFYSYRSVCIIIAAVDIVGAIISPISINFILYFLRNVLHKTRFSLPNLYLCNA
jgi:hypothetical protein